MKFAPRGRNDAKEINPGRAGTQLNPAQGTKLDPQGKLDPSRREPKTPAKHREQQNLPLRTHTQATERNGRKNQPSQRH
jgi:hypothetical protein